MRVDRSYLDEKIKEEIAIQVKQQVEVQLKEHVPVSLEEQIIGSRGQIIEVRHALMNSSVLRIPLLDLLDDLLCMRQRSTASKLEFAHG